MSNTSAKGVIADLVKNEDSKNPLSDKEIVEILSKRGIPIARRTVAKYRNGSTSFRATCGSNTEPASRSMGGHARAPCSPRAAARLRLNGTLRFPSTRPRAHPGPSGYVASAQEM